jgi:hypothetical protein
MQSDFVTKIKHSDSVTRIKRKHNIQIGKDFTRRDLNNFIIRFYITTPFWGLLLKYNVI